ncbi:DNA-binding response regulator, OmpR family, contains REC and winged-helix (wHTH) domain [Clostridium collagenovorans DSM 3089]|uniref:Stage 0 sporulation protein A homolog n=1 Tax=Clostridium collagenovorans DSM 3089 TaxID=1121306 RepID=A0A1M5TFT9_9CLOT|nr:response regulator transcription factor [Clostridium collagenovorans]SHH49612.1 DNA-binding response regulator, OmpR family, contains REC and winged-helix (wHTH) domain [Clostridium collagenovorans DSM 3089]
MCKILIVEDESSIRSFLKVSLKSNKFDVIEAEDGLKGLELARIEKPQIAVLDVMMPNMDGFQLCKKLREEFPDIGIIMLTARGQDIDKISGLESGADDYVVKPFNPAELILRVKAILRRMESNAKEVDANIIESYPFKIDNYSQKAYKNDEILDLTPKEYLLIKLLMENPGKAFSREELLNLVWGWNFFGESKIVDVNIRRLRTKIEETASRPEFIETVWGTGYRWNEREV